MRTGRIVYLKNTSSHLPATFPALARHAVTVLPQYQLDGTDLAPFDLLALTSHVDQIHLRERQAQLDAYLERGGTILFNGHVAHPFLPELSPYRALPVRSREQLMIHREAEHPLFAGTTTEQLSFRRGVAGFYGRGTNPPPQGALVLHSVGLDHLPVDWLVTRASGGRLLVHSGNEVWTFLDNAETGMRRRQHFFDWLVETAPWRA